MIRLQRLRRNEKIRNLVSQTQLLANDLILPYFVLAGRNKKEPIELLPGIYRLSVDNLIEDVKEAKNLGLRGVLIFGVSGKKDEYASQAYRKDGIVQKAIGSIRKNIKDIVIISDVCLCAYTTSGHCGIIKTANSRWLTKAISHQPEIDNDETLKILSKIALSHARAGADFVAPSGMTDGQVKAIREALDKNGFKETGILAYSSKYASNFYGPFREALNSYPQFGDRKSYQLDFRNSREALREIKEDIEEGADIVMVKPALAYLDIIQKAKQNFNLPIAAYNVSGEYALVKFGSKKGLFNEKDTILEILTAIKRAGADLIITYHAKEVAKWIKH